MAEPDAVMSRIAQGIELGQRGDRSAARAVFRKIGEDGEALYHCSGAAGSAGQRIGEPDLTWKPA